MVDARRCRLRRRHPTYRNRQDPEDRAARSVQGVPLPQRGGLGMVLTSLLPLSEQAATGGLPPPLFRRTPMPCLAYAKAPTDERRLSADADRPALVRCPSPLPPSRPV